MTDNPPSSTAALGRRLWSEWLAPRWPQVILTLALSVLTAAAVNGYGWLMKISFDMLEARDPNILPWAPVAAASLALIRSLTLYLQTVQTNRMALTVMEDIQNALFRKFLHADFARIQSEPVGSLVSRFTNDITLLRETLVRLFNNLTRDTLTIIGVVASMLIMDWFLTLLVLGVYPLAAYPVIRIGQKLRKTSSQAQAQMGDATSLLEESFSGTRMIKTYGLEDSEANRAARAFRDRFRFLLRITENKARVDPILEVVGGFAFAGLVGVAGWRLMNGDTSIGNIMGILTGIGIISPPIRALGTLNSVVQEGFAVLERVFRVLDEKADIDASLPAPDLEIGDGRLELDTVSFHYPDGTAALKQVSLTAEPGQTVALVGASGSGKSTILNLIPRLYDPQSGTVRMDGTDIRSVSLNSLRRHTALVSQDVTLFNDSVRANIAFGRLDADDDAIIAATKAADAHDFIMDLPGGYDAPVGPRGENLSGGQRQRLSIARAILKDARYLLLDEATSALDTQSEQRVQQALETLARGRTTLVIAHRLSTVRDADWIYVMDGGRIVEQGKHDDLIAADGAYAQLCKIQFGED